VRLALLDGLKRVLLNRGEKVSEAFVNKCLENVPQLLSDQDGDVRGNAAKTVAAAFGLVNAASLDDCVRKVLIEPIDNATDWKELHGLCLCIAASVVTIPKSLTSNPQIMENIDKFLQDDNEEIRLAAVDAIAQLLVAKSKSEESIEKTLKQMLKIIEGPSSDLRHRALVVFKSFMKKCTGAVRPYLLEVAPALIECVRSDRHITERCLVYALELHNNPDSLQQFAASRSKSVPASTVKQISDYCKRLASRGAADESDAEDVLSL